jgi:hypothetical protein
VFSADESVVTLKECRITLRQRRKLMKKSPEREQIPGSDHRLVLGLVHAEGWPVAALGASASQGKGAAAKRSTKDDCK